MVVTIIIILILATLAVVLAVSLRLFSIERVEARKDLPDLPDAQGDDALQSDDADGETDKPAEMVDVFDYFNEDEKKGEAASENDPDSAPVSSSTESADAVGSGSAVDKLTDLKNGRAYLVECKKVLETAKYEGHIYCACYFDYDRFSYINNLKGALTGDYVLSHTAQHVRRIFPDGALITRISCDHFVVVFPLADISLFTEYYGQMSHMCEKIRADIAVKTGMRVCVGFACTDNDASYDINVLMTRANIARHCFKVTKAEKFETYDETMVSSNFYGDTLMDSYSECQYADDFVLYFEKQLDLSTDRVFGCDTLARWLYDDKNAVASNNPITQDNGHIPTNNDKVIYHACRALSRWRKAGRERVMICVDLCVTDFFKADIDEFLKKCLTEFQIDPQSLTVKVDVSFIRLDWSSCSHQLKRLREIGVKICICGVDTGYTSLEFLSGLAIDYVKLHRSFAHNVDKAQDQLDKCRKIMERITNIGAKAIFEGVDSIEQAKALRSAGAKFVQGRYAGKPANIDELTRDLPEHIERRGNDVTVVLDDAQLSKGEYKLF